LVGDLVAQVPRRIAADDRHRAHEASLLSCLLLAHHQVIQALLSQSLFKFLYFLQRGNKKLRAAIYTYTYKSNSIIYTQSQLGTTYFSIYNTYGLWLQRRANSAFQELKRHILNEFLWWTNILKFLGVHRIGYLVQ
jgi:hypothetical protein